MKSKRAFARDLASQLVAIKAIAPQVTPEQLRALAVVFAIKESSWRVTRVARKLRYTLPMKAERPGDRNAIEIDDFGDNHYRVTVFRHNKQKVSFFSAGDVDSAKDRAIQAYYSFRPM